MSHINLDLQASHKMLQLLDEANDNTESIIDQFPGIFLIVNEEHQILRANLQFMNLFALSAEDVLRAPLSGFFRKENWKLFAHYMRQFLDAGQTTQMARFELGLRACSESTQDQTECPYHWTLTRRDVKNMGEGRLVAVFGSDVSAVREAEQRLIDVFTSIPLGIFSVNRDGRIGETYSRYLEAMLGNGRLAGSTLDEALFAGAKATMSAEEREGCKSIAECLGKSEFDFGSYARLFPQLIFRQQQGEGRDGKGDLWLKVTYQPIVFDGLVEQLLIILEDRTAIVNAERVALQAAKDREKAQAMEKQSLALYEAAIRDPLTGLYTRLYMKDSVAAMTWSHDHHDLPDMSVVIFDIDHFKKVNDTYGHKSGDAVLAQVGSVLLQRVQESDIPVRFGGEEFLVFLHEDVGTAKVLAELVRADIESMSFDLGDTVIRVTISAGVAGRVRGESLDDFMNRADQLLYKAKKNGRNQVIAERRHPRGEKADIEAQQDDAASGAGAGIQEQDSNS